MKTTPLGNLDLYQTVFINKEGQGDLAESLAQAEEANKYNPHIRRSARQHARNAQAKLKDPNNNLDDISEDKDKDKDKDKGNSLLDARKRRKAQRKESEAFERTIRYGADQLSNPKTPGAADIEKAVKDLETRYKDEFSALELSMAMRRVTDVNMAIIWNATRDEAIQKKLINQWNEFSG